MQVAVVGMGHVGAVTAACLARDGHQVTCLDVDPARQAAVRAGLAPVDEPGLAILFAQQVRSFALRAADDPADALASAQAVIVSVGTPADSNGKADLSQVEAAGRMIGATLRERPDRPVVILRSTVPPGTTEELFSGALAEGSGGQPTPVAHLPEFFREGSALADWRSGPFVVIGCSDAAAAAIVAALFAKAGPPIRHTDPRTAEALKYACNAWHATKVAFANEIGRYALACGARPDDLAKLFCADIQLNLGPAYLQPGFAYGGPCLAKDLSALLEQARARDLDLPLLSATSPANQATVRWWAGLVHASRAGQVAMLGLVHRNGSHDLRASPYLGLAALLASAGRDVILYEPALRKRPVLDHPVAERLEEALESADLVLRSRQDVATRGRISELRPTAQVIDLFRLARPEESAST